MTKDKDLSASWRPLELCVTEGNLQSGNAMLNLLPNPFREMSDRPCPFLLLLRCESRQIGSRYARDHLFMAVVRRAGNVSEEEPQEGKGVPFRMSALFLDTLTPPLIVKFLQSPTCLQKLIMLPRLVVRT